MKRIIRLLYLAKDANKKYVTCLILFLVFLCDNYTVAQGQPNHPIATEKSFLLNGNISLDSLTKYIHKKSSIRFSFNSVKVKGSREINFPKGLYSIHKILELIKSTTSLYYSFYAGFVVLQDNPKIANQKTVSTQKPLADKKRTIENRRNLNVKKHPEIIQITNKYIYKHGTKQEYTNKITLDTLVLNNYERKSDYIIDTTLIHIKPLDTIKIIDSIKRMIGSKAPTVFQVANSTALNDISHSSKPEKNNARNFELHYGIAFNIYTPLLQFEKYFTNTKGNNAPYTVFIPSIWLSKSLGRNKNEILFSFNPSHQFFTGSKIISTDTRPISVQDTTMITEKTTLLKMNGISLGLQYNFYWKQSWQVGFGLNFCNQHSALMEKSVFLANGALVTDTLYGINNNSEEWKHFNSSIFIAGLECMYNFNVFKIGYRMSLPITSIYTASKNPLSPINGYIFFNWRIK